MYDKENNGLNWFKRNQKEAKKIGYHLCDNLSYQYFMYYQHSITNLHFADQPMLDYELYHLLE